jgi:hypothetical protein
VGGRAEAQEIFRCHTGRSAPTEPFTEGFVIVGWRGGKSLIAALAGVYLAVFKPTFTYSRRG